MSESKLRVIKYQDIILSTFGPSYLDPDHIQNVSPRDDSSENLYPTRLKIPLLFDPTPSYKRGPGQARYGYPICWSRDGFEWYPYLPAVISFHYPIFKGMSTKPEIIHDGSGYRLKEEDIRLWEIVERVMVTACGAFQKNALLSLGHVTPQPPSEYGYKRTHAKEKFVRTSATKSLNAFQRLLGYCSFSYASCRNHVAIRESLESLDLPHDTISSIYHDVGSDTPGLDIVMKNLLSTLGEVQRTRNFAGIALNYAEQYSFPSLDTMAKHGVPTYVSWPGNGPNPYLKYHQHHYVRPWVPTDLLLQKLELENASDPTRTTILSTHSVPRPVITLPPVPSATVAYAHPMDYVDLRRRAIRSLLESCSASQRQTILDRERSAQRLTDRGKNTRYYIFWSHVIVDEQTRRERVVWTRNAINRHQATAEFECADPRHLWFDSELDEWNESDVFDFEENACRGTYPANDEFDEWDEFLRSETDGPGAEARIPATAPLETITAMISVNQFSTDPGLVGIWTDEAEFLQKRWGLVLSGMSELGDDFYSMKVGINKHQADLSVKHLFEALVSDGRTSLPAEFDLSPAHEPLENEFPHQSPTSILRVRSYEGIYLVDGVSPRWKLLIEDPITLLQIEREGWHLPDGNLVSNLVRKGIPFRVLYPLCQDGTVFYPHTGSLVHPPGSSPTHVNYLWYRLEVADFLKLYPHAHTAALSAGGILWRIAVDVLPMPQERDLVRPFHPDCCDQVLVDGKQFYSPTLKEVDVEMIIGMYKWSIPGQSVRLDSWWPKPSAWKTSGINFGAWAPFDETWFQKRKSKLRDGQARPASTKNWRSELKFDRPSVQKFLTGIRSHAQRFISENRL